MVAYPNQVISRNMVNEMEDENKIKEVKIGKFRITLKFLKLFLFTLFRTKWFLPGVSEITADMLHDRINSSETPILIDTRDRVEFYGAEGSWRKYGHIQDSMSIPIMHLAPNLGDLSSFKEKEIVTICPGGGMSLVAAEIMVKAGFKDVKNLKAGIDDWDRKGYPTTTELDPNYPLEENKTVSLEGVGDRFSSDETYVDEVHHTIDARNESCPIPVLKSKKAIMMLKVGQVLEILTTDPGSKKDIPAWATVTNQELISAEETGSHEFRFIVRRRY